MQRLDQYEVARQIDQFSPRTASMHSIHLVTIAQSNRLSKTQSPRLGPTSQLPCGEEDRVKPKGALHWSMGWPKGGLQAELYASQYATVKDRFVTDLIE